MFKGRTFSQIYKLGNYLNYKLPAVVVGTLMSVMVQSTIWPSSIVSSMVASGSKQFFFIFKLNFQA